MSASSSSSSSQSSSSTRSFIHFVNFKMKSNDEFEKVSLEDKLKGVFTIDPENLSFEETFKKFKNDFSIFTTQEMGFSEAQLFLFSIACKLYRKIRISVFNPSTKTRVSILLKDFIQEFCTKQTNNSYKIDGKTFAWFFPSKKKSSLPEDSGIFLSPPSSIEEFDSLFNKLTGFSVYAEIFNSSILRSESNSITILTKNVETKCPGTCNRCAVLFSLLFLKKAFMEVLYEIYPPGLGKKSSNTYFFTRIGDIIEKISSKCTKKQHRLKKFKHFLIQSLLLESQFSEKLLKYEKMLRKKFEFYNQRDYKVCGFDYELPNIPADQNPTVTVALHLGIDTKNIVEMTLLSIAMVNFWDSIYCKFNVSLLFVAQKPKKSFYIIDVEFQKLVFY